MSNNNTSLINQMSDDEFHFLRFRMLLRLWKSSNGRLPIKIRNFFKVLSEEQNIKILKNNLDQKIFAKINQLWGFHFYAAYIYSLKKKQNNWNEKVNISSQAIFKALNDRKIIEIFEKMMKTKVQTLYPEITPVLRLVINKLFDQKKKLIIYDFGCGQNIDIQIISSDYRPLNITSFIPESLKKFEYPVRIAKGIGIDSKPDDILWSKICTLSRYQSSKLARINEEQIDLLIKLKNLNKKIETIKKSIFKFSLKKGEEGDLAITKKIRHQYNLEKDQTAIKKVILHTIKNGGYWISFGEQEYESNQLEARVFKKKFNRLTEILPNAVIITDSDGRIVNINKDFFT